MLVVFGWGDDPQVSRTLDALGAHGIDINLCDLAGEGDLTLTSHDPLAPTILVNGRRLSQGDLIWDRSKFFPDTIFYFRETLDGESEHDRRRCNAMRESEWRATLSYLSQSGEYTYLNDHRARAGMVKPVQQRVAAQLGLKTPPSIVTTNHKDVVIFANEHRTLITKSLGGHRVLFNDQEGRLPEVVMTMACEAEDIISASPGSIQALPHFFQKRIAKDYETRVFVHEGEAHAFRVESQVIPQTKVDWRYGSTFLPFEPCEAPEAIKKACQAFLRRFSLFYGSFDFIVDPDGEWWFLECNQDGQWIWLDNACDHEITRTFAAAIARRLQPEHAV